jgi:glycerol-3-phosphate O-acyltransferase/dihydroxyacetone phosphate acyltransferase
VLFRFVLKVFYSNVIVEGQEHLTEDGINCMLCSNHVNSLTDALLLVTTVKRRSILRLTAKATQFHRGTFTSWLIGSSGALPIERPKDYAGRPVDNAVVFRTLIKALQQGDAVLIFPEGKSGYYPKLAPMKQGVARIVSDVLSQQKDNPTFELAIQTCSITCAFQYCVHRPFANDLLKILDLHRNLFRSDVLVTFHPPIVVSPATHPELLSSPDSPASEVSIRELTATIAAKIRSGTLDSKSWEIIRLAHTARRLYAPLGTKLSLGEYVRLTQRFVKIFEESKESQLVKDLKVS